MYYELFAELSVPVNGRVITNYLLLERHT